ncbi:MAG: hypothetical protein ACREJX_03500, partial [Polyangiaceae bacterium]
MSPELDALPADTKQLFVTVTSGNDTFRAFGTDLAHDGNVDMLLWPEGHECSLTRTVNKRAGSQMAAYDDHHVLVTGGPDVPSYIVDLSNGSIASPSADITAPRTNATATAFPGGVIVAGGEFRNAPTQTAEVFDAVSHGFTGTPIGLTFARTHHGAAMLANGNVVIVGGESDTTGLYSSLEVIDTAAKKELPLGALATLAAPRKDPVVL